MAILWSDLAIDDVSKNIYYLEKEWSKKEVVRFNQEIDKVLAILAKRNIVFKPTKYKTVFQIVITKQITLFYICVTPPSPVVTVIATLPSPPNAPQGLVAIRQTTKFGTTTGFKAQVQRINVWV